MTSDISFDIPELDQIGSMMNGLIQRGGGSKEPAPAVSRPAISTAAPRRGNRLMATKLATFAQSVNWLNLPNYRSPLAAVSGPRLGALTLATFAAGVNWLNAADGPRLAVTPADQPVDQPPITIQSFLDEFQWD